MNINEKLKTGQFIVEPENNQITFTDQRFYAHDNGEYYPSVSTILDAYPKNAFFYEWLKKEGENADNIRDAAGTSGSLVHQATERYDNGETISLFNTDGTIKYSTREWKMIERYVEFRNKYNINVVSTEQNIISPALGFAGTLDRVIDLDGKRWLIDIKTSNAVHNHYFLQMAAYVKLYEEWTGDTIENIGILWLNAKTRGDGKKGTYQGKGWQLVIPDRDIDYYWDLFRATKALWFAENGDMKPNNLTYSLTHKLEK
jgi:PD-(D/E)XK nuclease superfamily